MRYLPTYYMVCEVENVRVTQRKPPNLCLFLQSEPAHPEKTLIDLQVSSKEIERCLSRISSKMMVHLG